MTTRGDNIVGGDLGKNNLKKNIKKRPVKHNKTYRMFTNESGWITQKAKSISQATGNTISEARLIRAIIYLSKNMNDDRLIKACREVM